jgi:hypothetical protein
LIDWSGPMIEAQRLIKDSERLLTEGKAGLGADAALLAIQQLQQIADWIEETANEMP